MSKKSCLLYLNVDPSAQFRLQSMGSQTALCHCEDCYFGGTIVQVGFAHMCDHYYPKKTTEMDTQDEVPSARAKF